MNEFVPKIREAIMEEKKQESAISNEKDFIMPLLFKAHYISTCVVHEIENSYINDLTNIRTEIADMQNHLAELEDENG